jgi:peptidyl-dipeptidase A
MFKKVCQKLVTSVLLALFVFSIVIPPATLAISKDDVRIEAQKFIDEYSMVWTKLRYESSEAEWKSNTMIIEGDDTNSKATVAANEKLVAFTGSKKNIDGATKFLKLEKNLTPIQVKQLKAILYIAAANPEIAKALVKERITAETAQTEKLFGFDFKIDGKSVTTNQIDKILKESNDLTERRKAWDTSKQVGMG